MDAKYDQEYYNMDVVMGVETDLFEIFNTIIRFIFARTARFPQAEDTMSSLEQCFF